MNSARRAGCAPFRLCVALLAGCGGSAPEPKAETPRSSTSTTSPESAASRLSGQLLYTKTTQGDVQSI